MFVILDFFSSSLCYGAFHCIDPYDIDPNYTVKKLNTT